MARKVTFHLLSDQDSVIKQRKTLKYKGKDNGEAKPLAVPPLTPEH